MKLPKNIIRVLVEGLERAELLEMEVSAGYLDAKVATFPDVKDQDYPGKGDEVGQQAMIRNLKELFQKYAQANGKISQELVRQIMEIEDLEHLTDQIAIHIPLYYEEKQRILEAVFLYDRYEELCVILCKRREYHADQSAASGKGKGTYRQKSERIYFKRTAEINKRRTGR